MAPTICSSEKKRQIRSGIKELRLPARITAAQHLSTPPSASAIIDYFSKGALHSRAAASLRAVSLVPPRFGNNKFDADSNGNSSPQQPQISDNAVSSSTHGHEDVIDNPRHSSATASTDRSIARPYLPAAAHSCMSDSPYHTYSDESMDAEDYEVHSISNSGTTDGRQRDNASQLICCALKTVLNAPSYSDKQQQLQRHSYQYAPGSKDSDSQTYSDMCEIKNTEGLLAIAIKTIKLVKRNRMLQQRLAQLQLETSEFIQSVLANPENRHFREKIQQKGQKMEKI